MSQKATKGGGNGKKGGGAEAKNALDRRSSPGRGAPSLRSHRRGHWFESSSDHRIRQGIAGFFIVEVVEEEARIQELLPELDNMIGGGLITLEKARVILYRSGDD